MAVSNVTPVGSAPRSIAATHGLSREAGTTIIVGSSDTLETLARRYNVSAAAILQANGYKGPRTLSPGQQLIIPRPGAAARSGHAIRKLRDLAVVDPDRGEGTSVRNISAQNISKLSNFSCLWSQRSR